MAVLMIDVGNTCLKYCLLDSADHPVTAVTRLPEHQGRHDFDDLLATLPQQLEWAAIACVGHGAYLAALVAVLAPRCNADVRVAAVENTWDDFQLGYADTRRLGVDRWLAMLAVRDRLDDKQTALLADCGTAITVDYLSKAEHLGGVIAPGLRLMSKALNSHTADLPMTSASQERPCETWAHSTDAAIASGCLAAASGLLARQYQKTDGVDVAWLTGGDAELLSKQLPNWAVAPELVLEGVRIWACHQK